MFLGAWAFKVGDTFLESAGSAWENMQEFSRSWSWGVCVCRFYGRTLLLKTAQERCLK